MSIQSDLTALVDGPRPDGALQPAKARSAMPDQTARRKNPSPTGTGGIASPLTEPDYTERTWHDQESITTSDGVFTLRFRRVKAIKMTDANGRAVELRFAKP